MEWSNKIWWIFWLYNGNYGTNNFYSIKKSKNIVIEKHVKLKNSKEPDASTSITTEQLSEMISSIRLIEKANL